MWVSGISGGFLFVGSAGTVAGYAAIVAATCQRPMGGIGYRVHGGLVYLVTGETLALRSLCMGERGPGGKHNQAAEKTDFSLDSSHYY